jgi:hypothetical protein
MSATRTEYEEAAEAAIRAVIANPFHNNPALTDDSVAKTLAGLMASDDERIQLGAIKVWATLRQMADRQQEDEAPKGMEEILRQEQSLINTPISKPERPTGPLAPTGVTTFLVH